VNLIKEIRTINVLTTDPKETLDPRTLEILEELVEEKCHETYMEYISEDLDSFLLTDQDMMLLFKEATRRYTGELIEGMVHKGMLNMGVDDEGEIVYSLSAKGRKSLEKRNKK